MRPQLATNGAWLRTRLVALDKTQAALARELGLDPSAITNLLNGTRAPQVRELRVLADFFEVSVLELLQSFGLPLSEAEEVAARLLQR